MSAISATGRSSQKVDDNGGALHRRELADCPHHVGVEEVVRRDRPPVLQQPVEGLLRDILGEHPVVDDEVDGPDDRQVARPEEGVVALPLSRPHGVPLSASSTHWETATSGPSG